MTSLDRSYSSFISQDLFPIASNEETSRFSSNSEAFTSESPENNVSSVIYA